MQKLKSLEQIVADLRFKGELNDGALERYRKYYKKSNASSYLILFIIIVMFMKLTIVSVLVSIVFGYGFYFYIFLPNKKKLNKLLNIFSYGTIVGGKILKCEQRQIRAFPMQYIIKAIYKDKIGNEHQNEELIKVTRNDLDSDQPITNNLETKIIFLSENTNESWLYTDKLNNIFNLRKKT